MGPSPLWRLRVCTGRLSTREPTFSEWLGPRSLRARRALRPQPRSRASPIFVCTRARHVPPPTVCSSCASPPRSSSSFARRAGSHSQRPTFRSASSSSNVPTRSGAAPSTPTPALTAAGALVAARLPFSPWTAPPSAGAATSVALSGPCHTHVIAFDRRPCGRDGVLADVPRTLQCRIPTSFCGVYSLKPAAGRVSMAGAEG